ncbi:MAG: ATP-binding protein [Leptolyngbyaceae cyanobacterium RU_5_1]|nr:ATP-binding protein [Leptolyngbyaceae cyanobacterium RU_5_1]
MAQIFGDFIEDLPAGDEYLMIGFCPGSLSLQKRWRNNGLSADFLADYLITFFPGDEDHLNPVSRRAEIKGAVSYIANELLENAMKFNDETSQFGISIQLQLHPNKLIFLATNSVNPVAVKHFQTIIQELITGNPEEMYVQRLEENAADATLKTSGLGFLTMISDYVAKLGWKFEPLPEQPEIITVTTMVQLSI